MTEPAPVNPDEGQVAIPFAKAATGRVIGRLSSRALRWIEEAAGKPLDQIYEEYARRLTRGSQYLPVGTAAVVIWAGIENERRSTGGPGPEWTIDDADEIIDQVGLDDAYGYALGLISLSLPFKQRMTEIDAFHAKKGLPSPVDPLRAVARGTGPPSSPPASEQDSPTTKPGDSPPAS